MIGAVAGKNQSGTTSSPPAHNPASASPAPNTPTTPIGYTLFRSSADRFSIAIPRTWKAVDVTSPGAQAAINQLEQTNPNLDTSFGQSALRLAEQGIVMMAVSVTPNAEGFSSNVNVTAKPDLTYTDADLTKIASQLPAELSKLGATSVHTSYVTFDGRRALKSTDSLPLNTPSGTKILVDQTQYFVGTNGLLFAITLSGNDPALATIASSFSTS